MKQFKLYVAWGVLAIIFLSIPVLLFSNSFYYSQRFDHYGVYSNFDLTKETVNEKFQELSSYLLPWGSELDEEFFSTEDLLHLRDVKLILNFIYLISTSGFLFVIFNPRFYSQNRQGVTRLSRYYLAAIALIFLFVSANFDWFFTMAHQVVFPNDYWLLDPVESNLIKFFPQELFYEVFAFIVILNICLHLSFIMIYRLSNEK